MTTILPYLAFGDAGLVQATSPASTILPTATPSKGTPTKSLVTPTAMIHYNEMNVVMPTPTDRGSIMPTSHTSSTLAYDPAHTPLQ